MFSNISFFIRFYFLLIIVTRNSTANIIIVISFSYHRPSILSSILKTFSLILDIHSWWEVPSIAHFCSLFRVSFDLLDFDIEVSVINYVFS